MRKVIIGDFLFLGISKTRKDKAALAVDQSHQFSLFGQLDGERQIGHNEMEGGPHGFGRALYPEDTVSQAVAVGVVLGSA